MSFPEAVGDLARGVGLDVPRITTPGSEARREEAQDLSGLMLEAAKMYRTALKDSPRAIEYLKRRGLTGPIAVQFGIGYAADDWQPLAAMPGYADKAMETAGLVITGDGGKRYDRFATDHVPDPRRRRPRDLPAARSHRGAQYLNSPERRCSRRARALWAVQTRQAIRTAGPVSWSRATWTSSPWRSTASSTRWRRSARQRRRHMYKSCSG
jgi:DNA primase